MDAVCGERHEKIFASLVVSVQPAGIVHDIPCRSHFASLPPASVAACMAVATPGSGFASLSLTAADEPELELLFLNLSERLHRESARPINNASAICFILENPTNVFTPSALLLCQMST